MPELSPGGPPDIWSVIALVLHVTAAIAAATLAIWLRPRVARLGTAGRATVAALLATALWSLAEGLDLRGTLLIAVLQVARDLAWLLVVYRLFADDGRHSSLAPIRPVLLALVFVELALLGIDLIVEQVRFDTEVVAIAGGLGVMLHLLVTVGALVLVHNLYGGAAREARLSLRWPTAGLAVLWVFELNLYTVAYLAQGWPREMAALRGLATIGLVSLLAIGATHGREALRLRPSRAVTFQTFSLLLIGVYLVGMVLIAQSLSYVDGNFARLIELCFLTVASAVALLALPSRRMRSWLKVMVTKHLFQHRYDYREEWLRFTRTIGTTGPDAAPLGERVVKAVADVTGSPAGLLLVGDENGEPSLAARWNWTGVEGPMALSTDFAAFLERENFIAELDDMRQSRGGRAERPRAPGWLLDDPRAWALVPLIHYDRLVAVVVLARPPLKRKLDWEDFDLLRVIGQQLASYLAENASQEALAEAGRFDDFNRRIAFVMHDIKNLASQFSLLARNAELHAEKKAFRDDMLVTLRSSSEKLNALIARLSRYGTGGLDRIEEVALDEVARAVIARFAGNTQVRLAECQSLRASASRHSLEQVLAHLVQNALDASASNSPVFLSLVEQDGQARIEVVDAGSGMSPEFVRNRLFKPFVSTKSGGFGIGAFEARELVRAMRGRLDVDSREGIGSRFIVRLPLKVGDAGATRNSRGGMSNEKTPSLPKLLIVEDDAGLQAQLKWSYEDFEVLIAGDRASALALLRSEAPDVVTLDLGLPPDPDGVSEGFAVLDEIMALKPDTKVIVASGHGARESALHAIARGAYDFYQKPVDIDALGLIVRRALQLHRLEDENRRLAARVEKGDKVLGRMITAAPEMLKVARTIERVANTKVSVMLLGASGTGKELLARGLHEASDRSGGAFVAINCAAIPENLLESELFGHEKGAFTGAIKTTEGKIEQAAGGTLFLDEVGDIPLQLQVKLLRFLQERVIERVGSRTSIPVDTRVVCATHQDLEAMIAQGRFREDLYYRLAEIVVRIPTLAERPGDATLLAKTFLTRFAKEMNPSVRGFAADALAAIDGWAWPGNVRELENRVKRAVIMADEKLVHAADLDLAQPDEQALNALNLKTAREAADRKVIRHALARSEGNISSTAKMLGISRPTLYDLLKQYDLHG